MVRDYTLLTLLLEVPCSSGTFRAHREGLLTGMCRTVNNDVVVAQGSAGTAESVQNQDLGPDGLAGPGREYTTLYTFTLFWVLQAAPSQNPYSLAYVLTKV